MTTGARAQSLRSQWEQQIVRDVDVSGSTLLVLLLTASHGNADGSSITVGESWLGTLSGCGERTVRRALQLGRDLGYLVRENRGYRLGDAGVASRHRLVVPSGRPLHSPDRPATTNGSDLLNRPAIRDGSDDVRPAKTDAQTGQNVRADRTPQQGYHVVTMKDHGETSRLPHPDRCTRHQKHPADGPCPPCGDARRAQQRGDQHDQELKRARDRDRRAAIDACGLCNQYGRREHGDDRRDGGPCTHDYERNVA